MARGRRQEESTAWESAFAFSLLLFLPPASCRLPPASCLLPSALPTCEFLSLEWLDLMIARTTYNFRGLDLRLRLRLEELMPQGT